MEYYLLVLFFVFFLAMFGASLASFLNVVIWRLPEGMSLVRPASFCPKCGHPIRFYDNLPILGWILLKGKCRDCRAPISPRYPIIETLGFLVFGVLGFLFFFTDSYPFSLFQARQSGFLATEIVRLEKSSAVSESFSLTSSSEEKLNSQELESPKDRFVRGKQEKIPRGINEDEIFVQNKNLSVFNVWDDVQSGYFWAQWSFLILSLLMIGMIFWDGKKVPKSIVYYFLGMTAIVWGLGFFWQGRFFPALGLDSLEYLFRMFSRSEKIDYSSYLQSILQGDLFFSRFRDLLAVLVFSIAVSFNEKKESRLLFVAACLWIGGLLGFIPLILTVFGAECGRRFFARKTIRPVYWLFGTALTFLMMLSILGIGGNVNSKMNERIPEQETNLSFFVHPVAPAPSFVQKENYSTEDYFLSCFF